MESAADETFPKNQKMTEVKLRAPGKSSEKMTKADIRHLAHELHVHQIELENQNEELRHAQNELLAAHARYVELYDFAPVGYFTLDRTGNILDANLCGAAMLAVARATLRKKSFFLFIDHEHTDTFTKHLRLVFQEGKPQDCVARLISGDQDRFYAQLKSAVLPDGTGEAGHCCMAVCDISESMRAELVLKKSNEQIRMFAWSVAHDLKNPALAVHGLTKRLHKSYRHILDHQGGMYCEQILQSSGTIIALIDKINEYILSGEAPLKIETVELQDLFQTIREEFIGLPGQCNARLVVLGDPPAIRVDRRAILNALRNLVDNALKYGGAEMTTIEIGYGEAEGHHILCVQDDGVGIALDETKKLFKQFIRLESSKNISGSGLGLSIVKNIAEKHQGRVWTEPALRQGTIFCMSVSKQL